MQFLRSIMLGIAGSVVIASGAMAADVPPIAVVPAPSIVVAPPPPAFDWAGPYVGAYGYTAFPFQTPFGATLGLGVGYNMTIDRFVVGAQFGAEMNVGVYDGYAFVGAARAGVLLGSNVLAYGTLEVGYYFGAGTATFWGFGGGLEVALGNSTSMFAQFGQQRELGGPGVDAPYLRIGFNFHPGN